MKKREYAEAVERCIPQTPPVFHQAMSRTLEAIAAQAPAQERAAKVRPALSTRRALAFALAALLLIATAAVAATHWNLFDALSFLTGANPTNADLVMRRNLYQTTINNVEITVREAGYDGRTLLIQYAYRMLDVDTPLGLYREEFAGYPEDQREGILEEDSNLLYEHNVGWWIDQLWIDGQCVDMPGNSGGVTTGTPNPGEIVQTEYWRLDNEGVTLSGTVEISLPIGERQPLEEYMWAEHPEKYDADGNLLLPEKGIVTFTLDTDDILSKVRCEYPNIPMEGETVTAQATEVCYSPLMTYITLELEAAPGAVEAYQAENGKGYYDEDGNLLWEYSGMDVFGDWICSLPAGGRRGHGAVSGPLRQQRLQRRVGGVPLPVYRGPAGGTVPGALCGRQGGSDAGGEGEITGLDFAGRKSRAARDGSPSRAVLFSAKIMPRTAVAPDALKDPHDFFNAPEAFRVLQIVPRQNDADGVQRLISRVVDQRLRICGNPWAPWFFLR